MLDIMEATLKHFIVLATMLAPMARAHSWVEELTLLAPNGNFIGPRGYPRGMVQRTTSFQDDMMEWQLPSDNSDQITSNMTICRPSQQTANYTEGNSILQAPAGSSIALRYQENGHVTQPWIPYGKPEGSGAVYIYGTTQPLESDTLVDIYKNWTIDGTGGDGRGRLLTSQFFDDGQCYQISDAAISVERQHQFPRKAEAGSVEGANLWCQTDVKLPSDLSVGTNYTLYWVWDWSTMNTSDSVATPQFYTTCMDVSISGSNSSLASGQESVSFASITNYGEAAISKVFESLAAVDTVTVPASLTPGYFTSEAMITSFPSSTTVSTSIPLSSTTSLAAGQVGGGGAAAKQQPTQSACSVTSTITTTTVSVSTSIVTATVTSTVTTVLTQSTTTVLPSARMARRRLLGLD